MHVDKITELNAAGIGYLLSDFETERQLLLIHGAPGSAYDWLELISEDSIARSFKAVSIDRPGYGKSASYGRTGDVNAQVKKLVGFAEAAIDPRLPLCIVGHSYGACVAAGLAKALNDRFKLCGIVLVAGVLEPDLTHRRWYHTLLGLKTLRLFVGEPRHRGSVEMKRVGKYLSELQSFWQEFDKPVKLIHGDQDWIVDIAHSRSVDSRCTHKNSTFVSIPGAGHDLPKTHAKTIADSIGDVFNTNLEGAMSR